MDELTDILNRQKEKLKSGEFNSNNFKAMKAGFQELERLVSDIQSSVEKQEQKEEELNSATASTVEVTDSITSDNKLSM